jgi:hypothetical protein
MPVTAPAIIGGVTTFAGSSPSATITLTRPSGVQSGDLLVAVLRTNGNTSPTDFARSGWERRGYPFIPSDSSGRVTTLMTHRITDVSSEPSSYTFTKSVADDRQVGAMFIVRGVDSVSPVTGFSPGTDVVSAPTIKARAFNTDTADSQLLIYVWASEITAPNSTTPVAPPAGSTQVALVQSASGTSSTRSTIWVGTEIIATSAVDAKSLTWSTANGVAAVAVAFRGTDGVTPPETSGVKFKLRRGTTAQWASANPILSEGEPGVDLSTGELKIGDGTKTWADLPGISGGSDVRVIPNINSIPAGTPAGVILFQAN